MFFYKLQLENNKCRRRILLVIADDISKVAVSNYTECGKKAKTG